MWGEIEPKLVNENKRKTGYLYEELMMWHNSGTLSYSKWTEPLESWENSLTKSRLNSLIEVSGLKNHLKRIKGRKALKNEILRFHTEEYVNKIINLSEGEGGNAGDIVRFGHGGYEIATLSVGSVLTAVEAIMSDNEEERIDNAYCLVRPPGHHAERDYGMGFCIFNNIVLGALHARYLYQQKFPDQQFRIVIVDYDVHHGNGTQQAFWDDPDTLFICLHQDSNYPIGTGNINETGDPIKAPKSIINIPLPPGSGCGAYEYAFHHVVIPAINQFQPQIIFVSSGFDASFTDQLGAMMLSSESYRFMAQQLLDLSDKHCNGKIIFSHEGGYSKDYVPYCGLAVVETLVGMKTTVEDPYLHDCHRWGYQNLQYHQMTLIDKVWELHQRNEIEIEIENNTENESNTEQKIISTILNSLNEITDQEKKLNILKKVMNLI